MTNDITSKPKEKWYDHEMLWAFFWVVGIFALGIFLMKLGLDVKTTSYVIGGFFFLIILLPIFPIIYEGIKWVQNKRKQIT